MELNLYSLCRSASNEFALHLFEAHINKYCDSKILAGALVKEATRLGAIFTLLQTNKLAEPAGYVYPLQGAFDLLFKVTQDNAASALADFLDYADVACQSGEGINVLSANYTKSSEEMRKASFALSDLIEYMAAQENQDAPNMFGLW